MLITGAVADEVKQHIFEKHISKHYKNDITQIHMTPKGDKIIAEVITKKLWTYNLVEGEYEPIEMPMNDR